MCVAQSAEQGSSPRNQEAGSPSECHAVRAGSKCTWHDPEGQPRLDPCAFLRILLELVSLGGLLYPSRFVPTIASPCTAPSRTTRTILDSDNLVLTYMECFSSATNLFGFLRLSEVVVE